MEEKKLELNGTEGQITVVSQSGEGDLVGADKLTFQDWKFSSKRMSQKGFSATRYTLTVQDKRPTVWEAMQTNEKEGIAFWRGEWQGETMSGVISRQLKDGKEGKSEEYYFTSLAQVKIPPILEKKEKTEEVSRKRKMWP